MLLAKVLSRVVASEKLRALPARQLLTIEPLEGFGDRTSLIALDSVQAGPGDIVLVLQEGSGAREALGLDPKHPLPAQTCIVGVVDSWDRVDPAQGV